MAFDTIAVLQTKSYTLSGQSGSINVSFDSAVTAGSTLVVIGTGLADSDSLDARVTSVTDTSANTWVTPTNDSYFFNCPAVYGTAAHSVASGSPTLTINFDQSVDVKVSFVILELSNVDSIDMVVNATTETSGTSVSTTATGTLTQTDNMLVLVAGGWLGLPANPTGWVSHLTQQNGVGGYLGCQVSSKATTTTTTVTGTVTHTTSAVARGALMMVLKATTAAATTYQYKFQLDATTFTSADTGITAYVWRNGNPDNELAEKYTGLAGDATAGDLLITGIPGDAVPADSVIGLFYNGTDTSGLVTGVVEAV